MDYEEFKKMFMEKITEAAERMNMDVSKVDPLTINRDADYIGIDTRDGKHQVNVSVEERYREFCLGRDIGEMTESIVKGVIPFIKDMPEIPPFIADNAKDMLYLSAVNMKMNKHLLKGIPYDTVGDLAIIPRLNIGQDRYGQANVTLTKAIFEELKLTKEEVMEIAGRNTDNRGININSLSSIVFDAYQKNMEPFPPESDEERELIDCLLANEDKDIMYVMTNDNLTESAALINSKKAMDKAYDKLGEDFYILPSSRHDLMIVPESVCSSLGDVEGLKEILTEANRETISKRDYLSDSVYRYDHRTRSVTMVSEVTKDIAEDKVLAKADEQTTQMLKSPARAM